MFIISWITPFVAACEKKAVYGWANHGRSSTQQAQKHPEIIPIISSLNRLFNVQTMLIKKNRINIEKWKSRNNNVRDTRFVNVIKFISGDQSFN